MFINAESPSRSLRSQPADGGELVLVVGDGHPTGNGKPTKEHYKHLEEWARSIYTVRSIDNHWSTQDVMSNDGVPLIGRITPDSEHSYVATGFNKWGMIAGTAAAMIITDTILGRDNPWTEVYDPSRSKAVEPFPIREEASRLALGEGAIIEMGGKKWQRIKIRRERSIPSTPHAGIWDVLFPGMMLKRPGIAPVMVPATTPEEK